MGRTLGQHLATRLLEIGITHVFQVPGDYNLVLLDQLLKEERLRLIGCCNELNAGYAADGYARARGCGAVCTTFTVGGLSAINAIAGAYSESLPIICITGGPNSNDLGTNRILHHTIGHPDWNQEMRCFKEVTCAQAQISCLDDAHQQIDDIIATALRQSRPVYLNICCNLAGQEHPTFINKPIPFSIYPKISNKASLEAAVSAAADFLNAAVKPVLVAGGHLRSQKSMGAFAELMNTAGYPVAAMVNAKGMVDEQHPNFVGTYWGQVSTAYAAEIVESADAYVVAGGLFNDYTTVGWTLLLDPNKMLHAVQMVRVDANAITIGGSQQYHCCVMSDFLTTLAGRLKPNDQAMRNYKRMYLPPPQVPESDADSPLLTNVLYKHMQGMLSSKTAVLAETGDSWFNCQKLKLPSGCAYEFQCLYGSIGWSVGATLGYSIGQALNGRRVIASIGDGSFQVTVQDITTMLGNGTNPVLFIINNGEYTIETQIHRGGYNTIHNWDYVGLLKAMDNGADKSWGARVKTEAELVAAIKVVTQAMSDKLCMIEAVVDKDDVSKELLEWGARVASTNSRPPNPQ